MIALWIVLGVIAVLLVVLALWLIAVYNGLVTKRNRYKNAYAQIDVQLQRRHDLIPNLVETVKGYMTHERETLERVIQARNAAVAANRQAAADPTNASAVRSVSAAEGELTGLLARLMVVREDYPELKADRQTSQLMEELSSTENRIAFARQAYNDAVMRYNTARESFPQNLLVGPMGFAEASLFEIDNPQAREAVSVSFNQPTRA